MAHPVFSQAWCDAWAAEIRASAEYRDAARKWEWPIVFVLRADPALGIPAERSVYLDLWRGDCRAARPATAEDVSSAGFVLSSDAATWREVLEGRMDPVAGIMRGVVRLERGSLMSLAMHTGSARALVGTAARVDTEFPTPP